MGIAGRYILGNHAKDLPTSFMAKLDSADKFTGIDNKELTGWILAEDNHLTSALLEEPAIELDVKCVPAPGQPAEPGPKQISSVSGRGVPCSISITLYGPMELFDDVGQFFQSNDIYLQDPHLCSRNVKYCNPHRLPPEDPASCIWTSELEKKTAPQLSEPHIYNTTQGLLHLLESHVDIPETQQPPFIRTTMAR